MCLAYARVPQGDPHGAARVLLAAGADPDAGGRCSAARCRGLLRP